MPNPIAVEEQLSAQVAAITDAQVRTLVAAWVLAFGEISADLEDSLTALLAKGTKITKSAIIRNLRLRRALAAVADTLEGLTKDAGVTITTDLGNLVQRGAAAQGDLIDAQLEPGQVLPDFDHTAMPDTRQLAAIVERSTHQVTSTLKPLAPDTYEVVRRELVRGVAAGSNPRETARRMVARAEDGFNFGLTRAMVIARTETLDAYREGARVGEQTHSKVLAGWVWLTHLGPRTCPSCLGKHGTLHDLDEAGPHDHQQGRCSRMPAVRRTDGSVNLSFVPDARKFFDNLPREDQVAIMGPRRLALLDAGSIGLADLTTKRTTPGWRDSWNVAPVRDLERIARAASA